MGVTTFNGYVWNRSVIGYDLPPTINAASSFRGHVSGEKTVLVVRITTSWGKHDCDLACAREQFFSPHPISTSNRDGRKFMISLARSTREGSYGKMWFNEARSRMIDVTVPDVEQKYKSLCAWVPFSNEAFAIAERDQRVIESHY